MARAVVQGEMLEYISNIEFSLNFEDKKNSVKVRVGDIVHYDGMIAKYKKITGEEVSGRTSSLSSAIASNWLTLNINGAKPGPINIKVDKIRQDVPINSLDNKMSDHILTKTPDYDKVRGGDFDAFLKGEEHISKVVLEKDRVVKKLDIAGDQVNVKTIESTTINSSTVVPKAPPEHDKKIIRSEDYNAVSSIPIKYKTASDQTKKSNTFTVDAHTPKLPDQATLKEINRVTRPIVQEAESQEARVVKTMPKVKMHVDNVEGITLKNDIGSSDKEIDFSAKTSSGNVPIDFSVKTSAGSTPVSDLSGLSTPVTDEFSSTTEVVRKQSSSSETKVSSIISKYASMLPEDWAKMHWVKKEQFIRQLTNKEFIKFILTVEPTKAIQNACRKRLLELEKLAMQK